MKEGSLISTEWICSTDSNQYFPDTFTIYDGGGLILYILESPKKKEFLCIRLDSREMQPDGSILEVATVESSYQIPFEIFSKQTFPARLQQQSPSSLRISIPKQQIVMQAFYSQPQTPSDPPRQQSPLPIQQTQSSSHPSLLKHPERRGQQQQKSQNKNRHVSNRKGKPSSNPSFHAQQKQAAPKKQEVLPQPSSGVYHNAQ